MPEWERRREQARLRQILAVLVKHGLKKGFPHPRHVRLALEELGPAFVKLGQALSARHDLLPEAYRVELEKLQDDVGPVGFPEIKQVIELGLDRRIEDLFPVFTAAPAASASMAQVHRAVLPDGRRVAVKVQRPGIRETVLYDLRLARRAARLLRLSPFGRVVDPVAVVDELAETIRQEMDFRREAAHVERFAAANAGVRFLAVPAVHRAYTTAEILVLDYVEGIKLTEVDRLQAEGYDLPDLGHKLAVNYCKQVFADGFFHADPHPGNILVQGSKLVYLDFGMMGELDEDARERLNSLLAGAAARDVEAMTRAVVALGGGSGPADPHRLGDEVEEVYRRYLARPLGEIRLGPLIEEILGICRRNGIVLPRELTLMLKGLLTMEGVVARLAPGVDLLAIVLPYARRFLRARRDPGEEGRAWLLQLSDLGRSGVQLPARLLDLTNSALAGRLRLRMEHTNLERAVGALSKMANRIVFALITAALIIGSSLIVNADVGPRFHGLPLIGLVGYLGAAFLGLWLLVSILRSGLL